MKTESLFCTGLDENDLPIVVELKGKFVAEGFKFKGNIPKNNLPSSESWNAFASIRDKKIVPFRSISDCYGRGKYFVDKGFTVLRLRMFFQKRREKADKEMEYLASVFARLDNLEKGKK